MRKEPALRERDEANEERQRAEASSHAAVQGNRTRESHRCDCMISSACAADVQKNTPSPFDIASRFSTQGCSGVMSDASSDGSLPIGGHTNQSEDSTYGGYIHSVWSHGTQTCPLGMLHGNAAPCMNSSSQ